MREIWLENSGEKFHVLHFDRNSDFCVVMAHGFGAIKEALLPYAKVFAENFDVLLFDYRHFGRSDGRPRQLISVKKQLEDWKRVVGLAKEKYKKVALFGTSFSGGHVIVTASRMKVDAVISQVPFVDGIATLRAAGTKNAVSLAFAGLADVIASAFGKSFKIPIVSTPGKLAFMNTPDAMKYVEMIQAAAAPANWENSAPARTSLSIPFYRPIKYVDKVECPILFVVAEKDAITPASATMKAAKKAKKAEVYRVNCGHFDVYLDYFDECVAVELDFLRKTEGF